MAVMHYKLVINHSYKRFKCQELSNNRVNFETVHSNDHFGMPGTNSKEIYLLRQNPVLSYD